MIEHKTVIAVRSLQKCRIHQPRITRKPRNRPMRSEGGREALLRNAQFSPNWKAAAPSARISVRARPFSQGWSLRCDRSGAGINHLLSLSLDECPKDLA